MARAWDWQKWGTPNDLIHQSDINGVVGKFACLEQFKRKKEEHAIEGVKPYERANGKICAGNAVHAVLHRILRAPGAVNAMLCAPHMFTERQLAKTFDDEFERERAGRVVEWYKVNAEKWRAECVAMLFGVVREMRKHVGEVVLAESAFVYQIDGMWLTGSVDLVYRAPNSSKISFLDWKTGAQKPNQIELDHGWQSGTYSGALRDAYFIPYENVPQVEGRAHRHVVEDACEEIAIAWDALLKAEAAAEKEAASDSEDAIATANARKMSAARIDLDAIVAKHGARKFGEFPERIRYVHLRDFIPYSKAGARLAERPEELTHYGLERPERIKYVAGDTRGPGFYHVVRYENDLIRLRHLLKAVVSWVRFGRFPAAPGELCTRCKYRELCLLDGYKPIGEEKKRLAVITSQIAFDGFTDDEDF